MLDHAKTTGDVISISSVFATLVGVLPNIAALFTIIWTMIRIYETKTVQVILSKARQKFKPPK